MPLHNDSPWRRPSWSHALTRCLSQTSGTLSSSLRVPHDSSPGDYHNIYHHTPSRLVWRLAIVYVGFCQTFAIGNAGLTRRWLLIPRTLRAPYCAGPWAPGLLIAFVAANTIHSTAPVDVAFVCGRHHIRHSLMFDVARSTGFITKVKRSALHNTILMAYPGRQVADLAGVFDLQVSVSHSDTPTRHLLTL